MGLLALLLVAVLAVRAWGAEVAQFSVVARILFFSNHVLWLGLACVVLRGLLAVPRLRHVSQVLIGLSEPRPATHDAPAATWLAWGGGAVATTGLGVLIVERTSRYYFTQDDNLTQFLPVIVHGCRSLFSGTFPVWNPHQFLGAPTASVGTYALTYPITWASYALARWGLGDEFATLEVFCAAHLMAGAAACTWALREFRARPAIAAAGAVSFALSGYFLVTGRSWFYMTPVAVWAPLLFGLVERLRRGEAGARWALATAAVVGCFFHAGNAQMWVYALMLAGVVVALASVTRSLRPEAFARFALAVALGVALAAPLLVPQLDLVRDVRRVGGRGWGIASGIAHLFLPWPIAPGHRTSEWGGTQDDVTYQGEVYFGGTVFMALGLLMVALTVVHRWRAPFVRANPWSLAAVLAFVLALGHQGILWAVMSALPLFNKFQGPVKLLPYVTLLLVIAAATTIERSPLPLSSRRATVLAAVTAALMLYHCSVARGSHYSFADAPYPPVPAPVLSRIVGSQRRVFSIAPERNTTAGLLRAATHNTATAQGLLAIHGYDPIVSGTRESIPIYERVIDDAMVWGMLNLRRPGTRAGYAPEEALRAYGVGWLLVHRAARERRLGANAFFHKLEVLDALGRVQLQRLDESTAPVVTSGDIELRALRECAPLAFAVDAPTHGLPVRFDAAGATVNASASPPRGDAVINVLWRPRFIALVDGRPARAWSDAWGRVRVEARGAHIIRVTYRPPWARGFAASVVLGGGALLGLRALSRRRAAAL